MGKFKDLCEEMVDIANFNMAAGVHILKNWKPTSNCGLSKKETRAAYVGFALGLYNASESILCGKKLDDGFIFRIYDLLCMNVRQYRDDHDGYLALLCDAGDDGSEEGDDTGNGICEGGDVEKLMEILDMLSRVVDSDEEE